MSGLLVAPMMNTFFLAPIPSISVRIWLITLSEAPPGNQKYNKTSIKLTNKQSLTSISTAATPGLGDGVQLIEEQDAGSSTPCLRDVIDDVRNEHKQSLTLSKTSLTLASDSPNHIVNSSGP